MTTQDRTDENRNISLPEGRTKEIPNLRPPDDWELNAFLVEVSNMVEEEDLERMKLLCTGKGGFGRGVLEKLDSLKFFDLLRQSERITKHNLIFLQALLWSIGRIDIHKKFVEFSRSNEDILHIFAPKEVPENGYKYVKFHIGGDTGNYSSQLLRDMRTNVARLLRVPERFVFVSGIEPSSSLLITLMVPEDVVYIIFEMTEQEMSELVQYHIIDITVEDKVIRMRGDQLSDEFLKSMDGTEENKKLLTDVARLEKEIESLQKKLLEANSTLRIYEDLPNKHKYLRIQKQFLNGSLSDRLQEKALSWHGNQGLPPHSAKRREDNGRHRNEQVQLGVKETTGKATWSQQNEMNKPIYLNKEMPNRNPDDLPSQRVVGMTKTHMGDVESSKTMEKLNEKLGGLERMLTIIHKDIRDIKDNTDQQRNGRDLAKQLPVPLIFSKTFEHGLDFANVGKIW